MVFWNGVLVFGRAFGMGRRGGGAGLNGNREGRGWAWAWAWYDMVGRGFCEAEDREDGRVLLIHFVQWRLVSFSMCERVGSINDPERV
jgi:hypothetical protein